MVRARGSNARYGWDQNPPVAAVAAVVAET